MAAEAAGGGGGALLSGPGQACLDALRCAAFLGQQHPQDLKEALLHTLASSSSRTTTAGGGEEVGWLSWLASLVSVVQGVMGEARTRGAPTRRRKKKRRRREGGEQAREDQEQREEEQEATASEEDEESGGAWRGEGAAGGQMARGQQLQQAGAGEAAASGASSQRPEQPHSMEVDPAVSVSAPGRRRADRVMTSDGSSSCARAVRRTAVAEALATGDVVGNIFSFLVGVGGESTARQSVRKLGQLGLVCRKWREVSLYGAWWGDAAEEMIPSVVWGRGEGGGVGGGSRGRVLEHGRMLMCERRVWCGEEGWTRGLSIGFEVFDRMDGLQMLSVRGPLDASVVSNGKRMWLGISGGRRWEVQGRPFSAASRDPEQRRFQSMRDFFDRGHDEEFGSSVCVRVSVIDERTGRRALLYEEEGKQVERGMHVAPEDFQPGPQLRVGVQFLVSPVAGQPEGVSEQERLYQLVGGDEENYEEHECFIRLLVSDGDMADPDKPPMDVGAVDRFVRSVLGTGRD